MLIVARQVVCSDDFFQYQSVIFLMSHKAADGLAQPCAWPNSCWPSYTDLATRDGEIPRRDKPIWFATPPSVVFEPFPQLATSRMRRVDKEIRLHLRELKPGSLPVLEWLPGCLEYARKQLALPKKCVSFGNASHPKRACKIRRKNPRFWVPSLAS